MDSMTINSRTITIISISATLMIFSSISSEEETLSLISLITTISSEEEWWEDSEDKTLGDKDNSNNSKEWTPSEAWEDSEEDSMMISSIKDLEEEWEEDSNLSPVLHLIWWEEEDSDPLFKLALLLSKFLIYNNYIIYF